MSSHLLAQLRSSNSSLQLNGLASLVIGEQQALVAGVLAAVIDCLGAEHPSVRAEAYRVLELLPQAFSPLHVGDIVSAALSELSNAESPQPLRAALSFLFSLPDETLLTTCATGEGMQALRVPESLLDDDALNAVAYHGVGRVLVRVWLLLDEGIESWLSVESQSEAVRRRDALQDFILDYFARLSQIILSQTPNCNEYCAVLRFLFDLHRHYDDSFDWELSVSSILGLMTPTKESRSHRMLNKAKASRIAFLLQKVVPNLFAHPLVLMHQFKQHHSEDSNMRCFITHFLLVYWKSTPLDSLYSNMSYSLNTRSNDTSIFASDSSDEVLKVSLSSSSYDLLALSYDWIKHYLLPSQKKSLSHYDSYEIAILTLSFLYFPQFQVHREEFTSALLQNLFHALLMHDMKFDTLYDSLLVCILLCARHTPWNLLAEYVSRFLASISKSSSSITRLRLLTEFWTIIVGVGNGDSLSFEQEPLSYCIQVIEEAADEVLLSDALISLCRLFTVSSFWMNSHKQLTGAFFLANKFAR